MIGTGDPFIFRNFQTHQIHIEVPKIKNGKETAMPHDWEINSGNPKKQSRWKDRKIAAKTIKRKKLPSTGVRIVRVLFLPVTTLDREFTSPSRRLFISNL